VSIRFSWALVARAGWIGVSVATVVAGCGGSGQNTAGFGQDDGGASEASSSGSGGSSGGVGQDGSTNDDGTTGSSSGSGPIDASLDIAFPDVFSFPDTGGGSGGGSGSSSGGDGSTGCGPDLITCTGTVANICAGGVASMQTCSGATPNCVAGFGCVACTPGTGMCTGNVGTACNSTGTGTVTNTCNPALGESCDSATGTCTGDCANVGTSYIGCEYYAVTMSNTQLTQSTFDFSVSISNASSKTATINITGPSYNQSFMLAAGAIDNYILPWVSTVSTNDATHVVTGGAYHIQSTEPITVYEFNAYEYTKSGTFSYTNDASLLIPVNAMTGNYRVVAGDTWGIEDDYSGILTGFQEPGMLAIIGTQANTSVQVTATGQIAAGAGLAASGGTVTLGAGDVLEIASASNAPYSVPCDNVPSGYVCTAGFGTDLSGSLVKASAPVMLIGGSDCTFMPANIWACDHIEQLNFPIETLRNDYLVTLPYNKNAPQSSGGPSWGRQFIKIVGTAAGTTLTADPPQSGMPSTLGAGQVGYFETTSHFHLTASQPVIVGQFMESQDNFGSSCQQGTVTDCGDPALSMAVATEQFRSSYQFIAPPSYAENWVNVIAPSGATVTIDGTAVSGYSAIGSSGYGVAHVSLCANSAAGCTGVHSASSPQPFGIEVYGYGSYTSYMYPGGLNLNRL
jgi:hypothetical protein